MRASVVERGSMLSKTGSNKLVMKRPPYPLWKIYIGKG